MQVTIKKMRRWRPKKNAKIIHGTHSENINFEISLLF